MKDSPYFQQAELMVRVLPHVAREACFALKGGTAINFFVRDLPRLSVDIDLAYLPSDNRETSIQNISAALQRVRDSVRKALPRAEIVEHRSSKSSPVAKLTVVHDGQRIKIEPNQVFRESVYPSAERTLVRSAQKAFDASVSLAVLSIADLYGGKLCAALDRQHPRDLFDVKILLDKEGITETIRKAFIVYLISSNRPIHELLNATPKPQKELKVIFDDDFKGMAVSSVSYEELLSVQAKLPKLIRASLKDDEKKFLLSIKERKPRWDLLELPGIDQLPAVQWKLTNLGRMSKQKHTQALANLKKVLKT